MYDWDVECALTVFRPVPDFPLIWNRREKSLRLPSAGRHPPWEAGWALTIRFNSTSRVSLKTEKQRLLARQKRLTPGTRSPAVPEEAGKRKLGIPHTEGRARPWGSRSPGKAALNPMAGGSAFKLLRAGTGKRIKSHLCPEAGGQTHTRGKDKQGKPKPHTAAGDAKAVQVSCEGRGWRRRLQSSSSPPHTPVTRKAGGAARIGAPRAPGGARSDGSGSPSWGRREREPRGLGERGPGPSPAPFLSPLHSGEPHFLRAAVEGAARGRAGEGAAGASAGSALFSAARPERAARPAPPARAHLLDGRHRVPALGHPGGEVGGGGWLVILIGLGHEFRHGDLVRHGGAGMSEGREGESRRLQGQGGEGAGGSPSHRSATGGGGSALLAAPPSGAVLFLRRHTRKFPAPTLLLLLLPRGHAAPGAGHTPSRGSCRHTPPSRSLSPSRFPAPPSLPHTLAGRGRGRATPLQPPARTCRRAPATRARPEKMAAPSLSASLSPSSPSPEGRGGGRRRLGNPSNKQDESSRVLRGVFNNKKPRAGEGEAQCLPVRGGAGWSPQDRSPHCLLRDCPQVQGQSLRSQPVICVSTV